MRCSPTSRNTRCHGSPDQPSIPLAHAPGAMPRSCRTESGRRRRRPMDTAPDGWEANHAVLSHLSEHRVPWQP